MPNAYLRARKNVLKEFLYGAYGFVFELGYDFRVAAKRGCWQSFKY
jgi:hypothetical protein